MARRLIIMSIVIFIGMGASQLLFSEDKIPGDILVRGSIGFDPIGGGFGFGVGAGYRFPVGSAYNEVLADFFYSSSKETTTEGNWQYDYQDWLYIFGVRCVADGKIEENLEVPLRTIPPRCDCGAMLRPDIVWFGEALPERALSAALVASGACDLMLVVGTSAVVQPAASMPLLAKRSGAFVIEINPDPTPITPYVDLTLQGKAGELVPEVVAVLKDIAT